MAGLKKIQPTVLLADEVYDQLFAAINTGAINPTKRLVQEKLADELQVSRTPVRDALLRLEHEGILTRIGRGGFIIRRITDEELVQIFSAREAVECHALGLLCKKNDPELADRLSAIVEREEHKPRTTITDYFEGNTLIHRAFVEETGNSFLLKMFDVIWNRSIGIALFSEFGTDELTLSLKDHHVLCDVVREGNVDRAREAMRIHIYDGLSLQRNAIKSAQDDLDSNSTDRVIEE